MDILFVLTGKNKQTGKVDTLSSAAGLPKADIQKYMKAEKELSKKHLDIKAGLYHDYSNLKIKAISSIRKVKSHKKAGMYKQTSIDVKKKDVDFTLLSVSPYVIRWKSGNTETVDKRRLDKLKKEYSWTTDF